MMPATVSSVAFGEGGCATAANAKLVSKALQVRKYKGRRPMKGRLLLRVEALARRDVLFE